MCRARRRGATADGDRGRLLWLYMPSGSDRAIAYNGSGRAPAAASAKSLRAAGLASISAQSPHAVTVPGAIEAWHRLASDHGTMPFSELLRPASELAETGVPLHERVIFDIANNLGKVREACEFAGLVLDAGEVPRPGRIYRNDALARTLRAVAEHGPARFYEGEIARSLVNFVAGKGGDLALEDFASHRGSYDSPVSAAYGGYDVLECPPNGQGVIALLILRILSHLDPDPEGPLGTWRFHALIEASRIAFDLRDAWLCDPEHGHVDWSGLLSDDHTSAQAGRIHAGRVLDIGAPPDLPEHRDTVYLTVVDGERNAFSLINSLFDPFGSGLYEAETGILLHSRGRSFSLAEGHPNELAPRKRPMSTIIPGIMAKADSPVMAFGVMGGHFQPVGHALLLSNIIDYGLDLQRAIDLPRAFPQAGAVWYEAGFPESLGDNLRRLGHTLKPRPDPIGGAQAIWIDRKTGVLSGASDWRKDGCAVGF